MDDKEKAGIIAEKVHGWHIAEGSTKFPGYGAIGGAHWFDDAGNQRWMKNGIGEFPGEWETTYDPATNVAQAIEAAEVYGESAKKWISLQGVDSFGRWQVRLGTNDVIREETLALAITDALVKAVSDG